MELACEAQMSSRLRCASAVLTFPWHLESLFARVQDWLYRINSLDNCLYFVDLESSADASMGGLCVERVFRR